MDAGCIIFWLIINTIIGGGSPSESQAPLVGQGQWPTRKVVDGVDIWTSGAPPSKYRFIELLSESAQRSGNSLTASLRSR
jgi:hypothetical protein